MQPENQSSLVTNLINSTVPNVSPPMRRWWVGLSALYLTLVAHLLLYRFVQGQCTSTVCAALALSQVLVGIGVVVVTLLFHHPVITFLFRLLSKLPPWLYLLFASIVLFVFGLTLRPEWAYPHMSLALSALLALVYVTCYGARLPRIRSAILIAGLLLLIACVAFIRIKALAVFPDVHILDEPWTLSWAVSYLRTGQPSDWIMGSISGIPYYSLPRYYALVAGWMQVVGVGLWEGRLFSLLVAALMIALTTLTALNLFNRRTALFTLMSLVASSLLVVGLRLRHDVGVGLAIAAALWMYSLAKRRHGWILHLLAGMFAGLGLGAHYHAAGLSIALAASLYLPDYLDRLRQKRFLPPAEFIAFCGGAALTGGLILALEVLPDVEQFLTYMAPRSPRSVTEFVESVVYHVAQVPEHSQLEFVFIVASVCVALFRRTKLDVAFVVMLVLSYLVLGVMASKNYGPFDYYSVPLMPIFGILIGRFFAGLNVRIDRHNLQQVTAVVACLCFLMPQLGYSLHSELDYVRSGKPLRPEPRPAAQWVLEHVPTDQTIMAEHLYFLWLYDYRFLSPLTPTYLPEVRQGDLNTINALQMLEAGWNDLTPDVVIIDSTLATSGLLVQLRDSGFFEEQGYQVVFEAAADQQVVTIYQRM